MLEARDDLCRYAAGSASPDKPAANEEAYHACEFQTMTTPKLAVLSFTQMREGNLIGKGGAVLQGYGLMGWRCGYIAVLFTRDTLLSVLLSAQDSPCFIRTNCCSESVPCTQHYRHRLICMG